jgi:CubicO group peptidase (beta-lactamase class C family)
VAVADVSAVVTNDALLGQRPAAAARQPSTMSLSQLESAINGNMAVSHISGLSICVVADSQIVWIGNYGYANIELGLEATENTVFSIGSISKTFVANAAMQLWENGYLDLDADINDYLPFEVVNPYYPSIALTMRMLLSHTAAIAGGFVIWDPYITWGADSPLPLGQFLEDCLVPGGQYYSPGFYADRPPGTSREYSNLGFALAGYVVEEAAGIPLEQYCQDSLFAPLDMTETSWFLANLDPSCLATPYMFSTGDPSPILNHGYPIYPCGGLKTSSTQLANHLLAFMQFGRYRGNRILDSTTVELMRTPEVTVSPTFAQGLGWFIFEYDGDTWYGHDGSLYGSTAFMYYNANHGAGFAMLSNYHYCEGLENIAYVLMDFVQNPDSDDDGYFDVLDNCPAAANPDQADSDTDGVGDVCDQCPGFDDFVDTDGDGEADGCDDDDDGDEVADVSDNCPLDSNPGQYDWDGDLVGDECDNCPYDANPDQADSNENSLGDACDPDCCDGKVGDATNSGGDMPTIGDISSIIDMLFINETEVPCIAEADVNQSGGPQPSRDDVTIGDVTLLIDHLFVTGVELNDCF